MASQAPRGPFVLEVRFERRGDGGLRASCDKVPGFHLSHADPDAVVADVEPALALILSEMYGLAMRVELAHEPDEAPVSRPASGRRTYVGQRLAA